MKTALAVLLIASLAAALPLAAQEQKPQRQDIFAKEGQEVLSLINKKKYDKAIELSEWILNKLSEKKLDETYEASTAYNNLGVIYYFKGEWEKADQSLKKALALRTQLLGPDDPQVAIVLKNLSDMHVAEARYYYQRYQQVQAANKKQ